jgi:hypothetical protein
MAAVEEAKTLAGAGGGWVLLQLDAGVYDIGDVGVGEIRLGNWIHLRGAGKGATVVRKVDKSGAQLIYGNDVTARISDLTLERRETGAAQAIAISISGSSPTAGTVTVENVAISVSTAGVQGLGIGLNGGGLEVRSSEIEVRNTGGPVGGIGTGAGAEVGGITVRDTVVRVEGSGIGYGLSLANTTAFVRYSEFFATGGTVKAFEETGTGTITVAHSAYGGAVSGSVSCLATLSGTLLIANGACP